MRGLFTFIKQILLFLTLLVLVGYGFALATLVAYKWMNPPASMVQIQRMVEAMFSHEPFSRRISWMPLESISPSLPHAVVAAEDARFYKHKGIDWTEVEKVMDTDLEDGHLSRGASTLTQQLIKNLFFTTHRSWLRKGAEFTLAWPAERILGKRRILELYLNVIEWGPGVFGAEGAARTWYGVSASSLSRDQAARLAAIIPSPRRRKPARMTQASASIQKRMTQMGW